MCNFIFIFGGSVKSFFIILTFITSLSVFPGEGDRIDYGVSIITQKTDSNNDKYEVSGVLFASYDGYNYLLNGDKDKGIDLVDTELEISVDGKNVKVYTNAATHTNYSLDEIELKLSLISLQYDKVDNYAIDSKRKLTIISFSGAKYIDLGVIQVDLIAGISLGGRTKAAVRLLDTDDDNQVSFEDDRSDKHYGSVDISIGADYNIVDDVYLYGYMGITKQYGEHTEENKIEAGLLIYGTKFSENIDQMFVLKTENNEIYYKDALMTVKDSRVWFMYKVIF